MSGKVRITRAGRTWHVYVNGVFVATMTAHDPAGAESAMNAMDLVAAVARRLGAEVER